MVFVIEITNFIYEGGLANPAATRRDTGLGLAGAKHECPAHPPPCGRERTA